VDPVSLTAFLAPFMPYLLQSAASAAEEAGRAFGRDGWAAAQKLWGKLRGRFEDEPGTPDAASKALADDPDDELARNAVAFKLREALAADPELRKELEALWAETEPARIAVAEARGVAVAGDVTNSTIVTGDQVDTGG
jgi:hypothetical protein